MKWSSLLLVLMCFGDAYAGKIIESFKSLDMKVGVEEVADGFGVPWGFDFIGPHEMIVTEREGRMKRVRISTGEKKSITGLPKILSSGQGGLLDVAAHPEFLKNKLVYFSYSAPYKDGNTTRLSVAKLSGQKLVGVKVLFTAVPESQGFLHFGSRITFDNSGHLFVTVGERGDRDRAQNLRSHCGKVIRLNLDGSVPEDNPFVGRKDALPEIWTYGHRNPQGLTTHPLTGAIWEQEHGPKGGDEINILRKGRNYGWPIITYGREYSGPKIGTTHKKGLQQPLYHFTPSIAPSGLAIYGGKRFKHWRGHVFSGALKMTHINHLVVGKDNKVKKEYRYLKDWKRRIRNVKAGPDGYLYFSTDNGQILRLVPQTK